MAPTFRHKLVALVGLSFCAVGCAAGSTVQTPGVARPSGGASCPVTIANGSTPPGQAPDDDVAQNHGNGSLWTVLPAFGVIVARSHEVHGDGSIGLKFGWWRAVPGELTISGRRLDRTGPPLQSGIPDGYGPTGFQATGIRFPSEGCWEVTGRIGAAELTFVVVVVRADRWLLSG